MNIVGGDPKSAMVTFVPPDEYLFGLEKGAQRGVYNRDMISVRIENVEPERIIAMDKYFQELAERGVRKEAKFDIILGPMFNLLHTILPASILGIAERGNCAMYTSRGLKRAGLVTRTSMYAIYHDMME